MLYTDFCQLCTVPVYKLHWTVYTLYYRVHYSHSMDFQKTEYQSSHVCSLYVIKFPIGQFTMHNVNALVFPFHNRSHKLGCGSRLNLNYNFFSALQYSAVLSCSVECSVMILFEQLLRPIQAVCSSKISRIWHCTKNFTTINIKLITVQHKMSTCMKRLDLLQQLLKLT